MPVSYTHLDVYKRQLFQEFPQLIDQNVGRQSNKHDDWQIEHTEHEDIQIVLKHTGPLLPLQPPDRAKQRYQITIFFLLSSE